MEHCNVGPRVDLQIQTYTEPVPLKYAKLATKYPWLYGYFCSVTRKSEQSYRRADLYWTCSALSWTNCTGCDLVLWPFDLSVSGFSNGLVIIITKRVAYVENFGQTSVLSHQLSLNSTGAVSSWHFRSGVTRLQWARVQIFQKGPLFPTQGSSAV